MNKTSPLRKLRADKDMTLEEASQKWGVSVSYLSELETGVARPSVEMAERLAKKTGLSAAAILGLEDAA